MMCDEIVYDIIFFWHGTILNDEISCRELYTVVKLYIIKSQMMMFYSDEMILDQNNVVKQDTCSDTMLKK